MLPIDSLSEEQHNLIKLPFFEKAFLEGLAGSGKTTAGIWRMLNALHGGVHGGEILIVVPQRTLAEPYYKALQKPGILSDVSVQIVTIGGLAQRMVELFWPITSSPAGFGSPGEFPIFLTLETAQYHMSHLVDPLLEEGLFDSVTIDRNRIYSQILDGLSKKAAVVGFPHEEIGTRLRDAWVGEPGQLRVYDDVQNCATRFRKYCLEHNLLDFSLQVEVFVNHLWLQGLCRDYLFSKYRHMIVDNVEEDTPVAHELLAEWLPELDSALIIFDSGAGYRRFLGADPESAYLLKEICDRRLIFQESFVTTEPVRESSGILSSAISRPGESIAILAKTQRDRPNEEKSTSGEEIIGETVLSAANALEYGYFRFYPQMLDWVVDQITDLIQTEEINPSEVAILAPYMSDALRFSLVNRMETRDVPVRSHRPSRSLREEPATQCLLTLAAIAHPGWSCVPSKYDFSYALMQTIEGIDLIRAQLLTDIIYRVRDGQINLSSFDLINAEIQERISFLFGERYEALRIWLDANRVSEGEKPGEPLDYFLSRLFGEVLSQPGFGYHVNYQSGEVAANIIESIAKFRRVAGGILEDNGVPLGKEYFRMVQQGVIAAQYVRSWETEQTDSVLIAPAYTFLMRNRPVDYQFWLDVGSRGWYQRLNQPLTHPYVLSRNWSNDWVWNDEHEIVVSQENLHTLSMGLIRRCRKRVYLGLSDLGEQGYEQRGVLLHAFRRVLLDM